MVPETITVAELANRMARRAVDVIKVLMKNGMMATANDIIMAARAHWFEGDDGAAAPAEGDAAGEASNG